MKSAHKWSWGGALGAVSAIAAIWATGIWDHVGWKTPAGHDADIAEQMSVLSAIEGVKSELGAQITAVRVQGEVNHDAWWCDEQEEYLDDLIRLKDGGNNSEAINQEIREQRMKMDDKSCYRFDDD